MTTTLPFLRSWSLAVFLLAAFSLAAATSAHATAIFIPNADFSEIDKPGSPGVTAVTLGWFTGSVGNGAQLSTCCGAPSNVVLWSDSTTSNAGDFVNVPGWTTSAGATGIQSVGNVTPNGIYTQGTGFGSPSSGSFVDSAASLGTLAANTDYTLTMDAAGINGSPASPSVLQLLANGTALPTAVVLPNVTNAGWITYSITYTAADIAAFVGDSLTIRFGTGSPANGQQIQWDNATLTANAVPEPGSLALLGLGAIGLLAIARRRRSA